MDVEKSRADFEKWAEDQGYYIGRKWGEYHAGDTMDAWVAWQASRASLAVELPERFDKHDSGDWTYWADQVDAALSAAGITFK